MFEAEDLTIAFGGVKALNGVSFAADSGEVVALIGPNGAGKTTVFNCINGFYACDGRIALNGKAIQGLGAHERARMGIARTFQMSVLLESRTVLDNVLLGAHPVTHAGFCSGALGLPRARREQATARAQAEAMLTEVGLAERAYQPVSQLSHGWRKRVELARALLAGPKLLLLDEPASGLADEELTSIGELLRQMCRRHRLTVLIVEHNMPFVMGLADRMVVLDFGVKVAEGPPREISRNPEVIAIYLGAGSSTYAAA
jgi:ABC-type branched-subunit amino acid transport system ATPase component